MRHRTRVKYCGITRLEDAQVAACLGVDALGFIFYEPSPRAIEANLAAEIIRQLPPFLTTVGLFVDADIEYIESVIEITRIDTIQFHGDESNAQCMRVSRPFIKALKIASETDVEQEIAKYPNAQGILLDTHVAGRAGGTGKTFDWDLVPLKAADRLIIAGGIDTRNVAEVIRRLRPHGVDVSSGIEHAHGKKDPEKMHKFMQEVLAVNA